MLSRIIVNFGNILADMEVGATKIRTGYGDIRERLTLILRLNKVEANEIQIQNLLLEIADTEAEGAMIVHRIKIALLAARVTLGGLSHIMAILSLELMCQLLLQLPRV